MNLVVLVSFDRGPKLDTESLSNSPMAIEIRGGVAGI